MTFYTTLSVANDLLSHYNRLAVAGADNTAPSWGDLGPSVTLWRKFRDGTETNEVLPEFIAEVTLIAIPEREPEVARAKLIR